MQHVKQSTEKQTVSMSTRSLQINVNVLTEGCRRGFTCCVCGCVCGGGVCVYMKKMKIQETRRLAEIRQLALITPLAHSVIISYNTARGQRKLYKDNLEKNV